MVLVNLFLRDALIVLYSPMINKGLENKSPTLHSLSTSTDKVKIFGLEGLFSCIFWVSYDNVFNSFVKYP